MEIVLNEEEIKFALAVEVFRRTGMRVQQEEINLTVSVPTYDGAEIRKIDKAILEIKK